jgi:hypothetical protein
MATKWQIENAAAYGGRLNGSDVARVSRSGGSVTLRHVWPDNCDARVWDGVSRAARRLAEETAARTGKQVCLQLPNGSVIDYIDPLSANGRSRRRSSRRK